MPGPQEREAGMGSFQEIGGFWMNETLVLVLQNKEDRESVALALYRAGYTVREKRKKDGGKTVVYLEYWKDDSFAQ